MSVGAHARGRRAAPLRHPRGDAQGQRAHGLVPQRDREQPAPVQGQARARRRLRHRHDKYVRRQGGRKTRRRRVYLRFIGVVGLRLGADDTCAMLSGVHVDMSNFID